MWVGSDGGLVLNSFHEIRGGAPVYRKLGKMSELLWQMIPSLFESEQSVSEHLRHVIASPKL